MIQNFHVKRGSSEDVTTIREFTRAAYEKWIPLIGREPLPMSADYEDTIKRHRFDLFYDDKQLVALIETINNDDHLLIENVCVSPSKQRVGIGKGLLDHAEAIARAEGYETIRLNTNSLFKGNVDLYLRHGYIIDWEKPMNRGNHVHMHKSLLV